MTVILGLSGSQILFLAIKLAVAFYLVRNALRRGDRQMALGYGITWLGIIMMSFYALTIPGVLIGMAGMILVVHAMNINLNTSPTREEFEKARTEFMDMFRERSNPSSWYPRIKKPEEKMSQKEIDEKYKKEKWK